MKLTVSTSTWNSPRNRYIVGISGVALAVSIAIGGISSLPSSNSREVAVAPQAISQPSTLFGTAADAVFAAEGGVAVSPQFANTVDAADASVTLSLAKPVAYSASVALQADSTDWVQSQVLPAKTAKVSSPQFANMADAADAATH
jgi:hypothetical protein